MLSEIQIAIPIAVSVGTAVGTFMVFKNNLAAVVRHMAAIDTVLEQRLLTCGKSFTTIGGSIQELQITTARMDTMRDSVRSLELNAARVDQRLSDVVERIDKRLDDFIKSFDQRLDVLIDAIGAGKAKGTKHE